MRYNAKVTEPKWQFAWEKSQSFKATPDTREEILCFRNVSISIRSHPYGPCEKLYNG